MFISWKMFSWVAILFSIFFWFLTSFESPIFFWFFLEVGVWGSFFFFLGGEEEMKSKNSMSFFIVQGACSLVWVLLFSVEEIFKEILMPMIIFLKMGLFPGHFWAWKIYESGSPLIIWIISFFQKILPLGMIYLSVSEGGSSYVFFNFLIFYNLISLIYFLSKEMNLNIFLLISSIMHFNNMALLLLNEKVVETFTYFSAYSFILFFALLFSSFNSKSLSSPESGSPSVGEGAWLVGAVSIVGFPPSLMFFIKLLFIFNSGGMVNSFFIFTFFLVFLYYLLILISSSLYFIHLSSSSYIGSFFNWEMSEKSFKIPSILLLMSFSVLILLLMSFSLLVLEKKKIKKFHRSSSGHGGSMYN